MKKIKLLNGIVMLPNDVITIDKTVTSSANFAGVVAEKNGTLPQFLFLSEKPIDEMTTEDEDRIYKLCGEIVPEVENIRVNEIQPIFDANGRIKNAKEWINTPRLGIFAVMEVESEKDLYMNMGIIRRD